MKKKYNYAKIAGEVGKRISIVPNAKPGYLQVVPNADIAPSAKNRTRL
jgi:hypothetical protein